MLSYAAAFRYHCWNCFSVQLSSISLARTIGFVRAFDYSTLKGNSECGMSILKPLPAVFVNDSMACCGEHVVLSTLCIHAESDHMTG